MCLKWPIFMYGVIAYVFFFYVLGNSDSQLLESGYWYTGDAIYLHLAMNKTVLLLPAHMNT